MLFKIYWTVKYIIMRVHVVYLLRNILVYAHIL